jgi:hypothetical protein
VTASRTEYVNLLKKDFAAYYGYSEFLIDLFLKIFSPAECLQAPFTRPRATPTHTHPPPPAPTPNARTRAAAEQITRAHPLPPATTTPFRNHYVVRVCPDPTTHRSCVATHVHTSCVGSPEPGPLAAAPCVGHRLLWRIQSCCVGTDRLQLLEANEHARPMTIRCNTLKTRRRELQQVRSHLVGLVASHAASGGQCDSA